jgi:hypothetical protein
VDVGTVHAYADGFAVAVVADDTDRISGYLSEELKGNIAEVLGGLPRSIRGAEVLSVTCPEDDECISVTRFSGFRGAAMLRATWIEEQQQHQPVIRAAWIVDGKVKEGQGAERAS